MNVVRNLLKRRVAMAVVALGVMLFAGSLLAGGAEAGFTVCGSDPIIVLADGTQITIATTIGDDQADVQNITYSVHMPVGSDVTNVTYSGYTFNGRETVLTYADEPPGVYTVDTVVNTGASDVAVSSVTTVQGDGPGRHGHGPNATMSDTKSGFSGQELTSTLDTGKRGRPGDQP